MKYRTDNINNRPAIVLILTVVILVVMSGLGYLLATKVAAARHRDQYIINYQMARYACDSGFKYVNTMLAEKSFDLISRPNEPDFSDLFAFTEEQYQQFLEQYRRQKMLEKLYGEDWQDYADVNDPRYSDPNFYRDRRRDDMNDIGDFNDFNQFDMNDANLMADFNSFDTSDFLTLDANDPNNIVIPGPYGPQWPLAMEPTEFEVGDARVKVEVDDENAKLPLVWALQIDEKNKRSTEAAYDTFFDWMGSVSKGDASLTYEQRSSFYRGLEDIGKYVDVSSKMLSTVTKAAEPNAQGGTTPAQRFRSRRSQQRQAAQQAAQKSVNSPTARYANFVNLVNSSLIDLEPLAKPYVKSERRTESALKYISRYGASQVNVNSAPRHVLEALFMFGGNSADTASAVIMERKTKPFADVNDLQRRCFHYADTIERAKDYLTTQSTFFTVRIEASCGVANVRLTALILKDGKKVQTLAIIAQ
ncbi:MAG: hypothetical protein A2178_00475 [Planctomycetes bacterium GWC2_49_10]|nr:MAG: hypothetical protein A2178_00475 [Planctomycetes bacterium GWC2_49_10]